MIIWLASYPKSGNTWVRVFLNTLFYTKDNDSDLNNLSIGQFPNRKHFENILDNVDDLNEFSKNCINAQLKINLSKGNISIHEKIDLKAFEIDLVIVCVGTPSSILKGLDTTYVENVTHEISEYLEIGRAHV